MRFNDVAYLVKRDYSQDEIGNHFEHDSKRKVFANRFSVTVRAEQVASLVGITPECELQLRTSEYEMEELLEYRGQIMHIALVSESGDFMRVVAGKKVVDA